MDLPKYVTKAANSCALLGLSVARPDRILSVTIAAGIGHAVAPFGQYSPVSIQSTSAENNDLELTMLPTGEDQRLHLMEARFDDPAFLHLRFADAAFSLPILALEMPFDRIMWHTAKASPDGTAMTISAIKGETIPIDSAALRCMVDEAYAADIMNAIQRIKISSDDLQQLSATSLPPQEWLDEPEDLRLDSWK